MKPFRMQTGNTANSEFSRCSLFNDVSNVCPKFSNVNPFVNLLAVKLCQCSLKHSQTHPIPILLMMDQRRCGENHPMHSIPFYSSSRLPCLLKKLVRFPVSLFIEEIHTFPENLLLLHRSQNLVKKLDRYSLGNLLLEQFEPLLQLSRVLRE